jgi:hypothetical protein
MPQTLPIGRIMLRRVRAAGESPSAGLVDRDVSGIPEREDQAPRFLSPLPVGRLQHSDPRSS